MSDTITPINYRQSDGTIIIIYSTKEHGAYYIDQIFDPANPKSGTYFPALYSIVVKPDLTFWVVTARDELTYSVTLSPSRLVSTIDNDTTKISFYGNDKFGLYVDSRVNPTKLMVDAKLFFIGNNLVEYALYRKNAQGADECISEYYDSTGKFVSNRIPLSETTLGNLNIKFPTNCHTTTEMVDSEAITLRTFDNLGNETANVVLYAHDAFILNDLSSQSTAIVELNAECLQTRGDDFYVYEHQDLEELNIRPYIVYADGTKQYLNVDNEQCFIYGLDDFIPSFPGFSQTIVIKYFLNHKETSTLTEAVSGSRFISIEKKIVVIRRSATAADFSIKLVPVPRWHKATESWTLRWLAYTQERNHVYDVTDHVTYNSELFPFDGTRDKWGHEQHIQASYELSSVFSTTDEILGTQDVYITLWDGNNTYARYTYRDDTDNDAPVYGAEGALVRRPVIHYDETLNQYFIPSTIFTSWESVVEAFYIKSHPPFRAHSESVAPTPDHFILRDADSGQMIIANAISKEQFTQAFSTLYGTPNLVGDTVVVEFLKETEVGGIYEILFGAPVDVVKSPTGYNTEEND